MENALNVHAAGKQHLEGMKQNESLDTEIWGMADTYHSRIVRSVDL